MSSGKDNYAWEVAEEAKSEKLQNDNWTLRKAAIMLHNMDSDTEQGKMWLWLLENGEKCYKNRKLIELLG